jgi:RNA polymerase sigma-70 factor (ECF subfamily)
MTFPFADADEVHERVDSGPGPERQSESSDLNRQIDIALDELSSRERAAFVLRHYHERSMNEIAETMDVAVGTVKSLLFRSTRKMRDALSSAHADWRDG